MTTDQIRKNFDKALKSAFPDGQFVTSGYGLDNSLEIHIEGDFTIEELKQIYDLAVQADQHLYDLEQS